jgi:arsenite-transporting ATPase
MYSLARDIGISSEMIEGLGLKDVTSLFKNPPPGIDEIVALLEIFKLGGWQGGAQAYDKIVIDTAPTGHTLRLLELPQFLDKVTGSLLRLRAQLTRAIQGFKNMFGGGDPSQPQQEPLLDVLEKLERYQLRLADMRAALKDASQTQFVVVTIPTSLAVAESMRLVTSLQAQGIAVDKVVCNQLIQEGADAAYLSARVRAQRECITSLTSTAPLAVEITEVPFLDTEMVGPYGLKFFASMAHPADASAASNPMGSKKLTIFGGKGGVGKTTSAAAWGVALADVGLRTLVVSTDPAHSLGDVFMTPLGDKPQQIELPGASSPRSSSGQDGQSQSQSQSQLWAMEIDPDAALAEFRDAVNDAMGAAGGGGGGAMASMGLPDLKAEVMNLLTDTDNPPPGTDEIVAMTRIISYLDDGLTLPSGEVLTFDRVVLDTAPTGHTLRMLALPAFLQDLVDKVKGVRDSSTGGMLGSILGGGGGGGAGAGAGAEAGSDNGLPLGEDRLTRFQERMGRLEDVLHNPSESEFSIVTIPTLLATAETKRLVQALAADSVAVRRIIINQVLPADQAETRETSDAFLTRTRSAQQASVAKLRRLVGLAPSMELLEVPHFDTELRTVFGLRLLGNVVLK